MCYRIVSINAQSDQHISGRISNASLQEFNQFAGQISSTPFDRNAPNDIRRHVQKSHTQICKCKENVFI